MINQICITSKVPDSRLNGKQQHVDQLGLKKEVQVVRLIDAYTIQKSFSKSELKKIAEILHNPVSQRATFEQLTPSECSWVIEIDFLPGVTDNVATTIKDSITDCLKTSFQTDEGVWTSQIIFLSGSLTHSESEKIAQSFANPLIQRIASKN